MYDEWYCYIVENGHTDGYARCISLVLNHHYVGNGFTEQVATAVLTDYVTDVLSYSSEQFSIRKTMNTYPEHFHIHAYVLPKKRRKNAKQTVGQRSRTA